MESKEPKIIPMNWYMMNSDLRKTAQSTGKPVAAVFHTKVDLSDPGDHFLHKTMTVAYPEKKELAEKGGSKPKVSSAIF